MSCAIVSLILLGTSAPLGILGLIKKQISTIMVTGVMYILAGTFYKRNIPCFIQFVFFAICIRRKLAVKSILQNIIQKKATVENALVCRKKLAFFHKNFNCFYSIMQFFLFNPQITIVLCAEQLLFTIVLQIEKLCHFLFTTKLMFQFDKVLFRDILSSAVIIFIYLFISPQIFEFG